MLYLKNNGPKTIPPDMPVQAQIMAAIILKKLNKATSFIELYFKSFL
jgi:hypothetical protein